MCGCGAGVGGAALARAAVPFGAGLRSKGVTVRKVLLFCNIRLHVKSSFFASSRKSAPTPRGALFFDALFTVIIRRVNDTLWDF